jgi:uridine kinase
MKNEIKILAICGGSGSGKTYLANKIHQYFGQDQSQILLQDNYYIDQSKNFDFDGGKINFDHPNSLDWPLMKDHLLHLKNNNPIEVPIYDFATHTRSKKGIHFEPKPIIILDGILILSQASLIPLIDLSIFVDTPEEIRFFRRLDRDVIERGRSREGVYRQYMTHVKPMHYEFVEPSKNSAHIVYQEKNHQDINDFIVQTFSAMI